MLPPIFTTGAGSLTIVGPGQNDLTISGQNKFRPFFIVQGTVGIANLTIANGLASISTVPSSVNENDICGQENRMAKRLSPNQGIGVGSSARREATR
jgi:hypothetical protein